MKFLRLISSVASLALVVLLLLPLAAQEIIPPPEGSLIKGGGEALEERDTELGVEGDVPAPERELAYRFQVPEGWEELIPAHIIDYLVFTPIQGKDDQFRENLNVVIERVGEVDVTAAEALEFSLPVMEQMLDGFEELGRAELTVAGTEAMRLRYRAQIQGFELDNDVTILVHEGLAYFLTASMIEGQSRQQFEGAFAELVGTMSFVGGENAEAVKAEGLEEAVRK